MVVAVKLSEKLYYYPETGFTCNSYVIEDGVRVLVDPGHYNHLRDLVELLAEDGFELRDMDWIINTHAHVDHCGANYDIQRRYDVKVAMHEAEKSYLEQVDYYHRLLGEYMPSFTVHHWFRGVRDRCIGDLGLIVIHTPGHTPGSISLYSPEKRYLISGDLVFQGGVGRTDLGGSDAQLKASIEFVSKLDVEMLLPGHGPLVVGKSNVVKNFKFVKEFIEYFL